MSFETRKPTIKLTISYDWFNLLVSVIKENTKTEESVSPTSVAYSTNELINKLMKYSRPFTDNETNIDCVDIRFFPNEASEMIWQLLHGYVKFSEESENFYLQLKNNYIPKEKKNKTE